MEIDGPGGPTPARIYRPSAEVLPVMLYFHGGGWVAGSVKSHDSLCRSYSHALRAVIVSVEYRLAPEDPFPAGLEDCYKATAWVPVSPTIWFWQCF